MVADDASRAALGLDGLTRTTAQRLADALKLVNPICGKTSEMSRHLRKCSRVAAEVKQRAVKEIGEESGDEIEEIAAPLSTVPAKRKKQAQLTVVSHKPWNTDQQKEFGNDICKLFVAVNLPWNAAGNQELIDFVLKYIPSAKIPDRKALSGSILDKQVESVTTATREKVEGKLATGMVDGWKNISKDALQATCFNVEGKEYPLRVHNVTADRKTSRNLFEIVKADIATLLTVFQVCLIAWCCDSGGDSRGLRPLLLEAMPWLIVIECWAHQINLVVGDYFKHAGPRVTNVLTKATLVIVWFTSHTRALGLLHTHQTKLGDSVLAFVQAVLTRWTTHYLSLRRLQHLSKAIRVTATFSADTLLEIAGKEEEQKEKAQRVIDIILDPEFWKELSIVKVYLEPLALAANISQSATTRLDHILIAFGGLHFTFSDDSRTSEADVYSDLAANQAILNSLAKRWLQCDQDVFIVAVFLNPFFRGHFFEALTRPISRSGLYDYVKRVYQRVFREQAPFALFDAYMNYYDGEGIYTAEKMYLEEHRKRCEEHNMPLDVATIWRFIEKDDPFAKLGRRIHSVVANSAGAERHFSRMGLIHTKLRNRLHEQRVQKTAILAQYIREKHRDGAPQRKKRRVVDGLADDDDDDESGCAEAVEGMVSGLQNAANDDQEAEILEGDTPAPETPPAPTTGAGSRRVTLHFPSNEKIPLGDMFNRDLWNTTSPWGGKMDMFKDFAKRTLDAEMEALQFDPQILEGFDD